MRYHYRYVRLPSHQLTVCSLELAFHDADTDTDILADIVARIVARMSACRSACHRNNFRKSRVLDMSVGILVRMSVSASWNASYTGNSRAIYLPPNRDDIHAFTADSSTLEGCKTELT